jgi:hypothetical protein
VDHWDHDNEQRRRFEEVERKKEEEEAAKAAKKADDEKVDDERIGIEGRALGGNEWPATLTISWDYEYI